MRVCFSPAADDSSDDEPLIKMVKKAPSDEELKETVRSLLKEANLEEMTMKQICQRVRASAENMICHHVSHLTHPTVNVSLIKYFQ